MAMPPFSGFFSKDEILWSLFASQHYALWVVASLTGLFTVFYMTKLTIFTFFKSPHNSKQTPHDPEWFMTVPLIVLAILAFLGRLIGYPSSCVRTFSSAFSSYLT